MKKSKTVKIQIDQKTEKEFTVTELSVAEIIDLGQKNPLFGATLNDEAETTGNNIKNHSDKDKKKKEKGMLGDILDISKSAQGVMKISCDFDLKDLKALPPSDIEILFNNFKEVNATFLTLLEKMGVIEVSKQIAQKAMSDFLKMLAI